MERQMQENAGKKQQQFSATESRTKSSGSSSARKQTPLAPQEEKQKAKIADGSTDPIAMTDRDQRRVAELAYVLYEQCGREDGHDMNHWLEAERRVLGRKSRT
ncbi:MAG: DUF2934 domain-containing protein [Nitrospirota bacterium]